MLRENFSSIRPVIFLSAVRFFVGDDTKTSSCPRRTVALACFSLPFNCRSGKTNAENPEADSAPPIPVPEA